MHKHDVQLYPATQNKLAFLENAIRAMFKIMDRYIDHRCIQLGCYSDRPYIFNERATLGIFAGGIWTSDDNNLVLEEFCTYKGLSSVRYRGRQDIRFLASGKTCYGEAKQGSCCWPCAVSFTRAKAKRIMDDLARETEAVIENICDRDCEVNSAVGILFVVPHVKKIHMSRSVESLAMYHDMMRSELQSFHADRGYHVIRGEYFRDDLLEEKAYYDSNGPPTKLTRPALDILICTREMSGTPADAKP